MAIIPWNMMVYSLSLPSMQFLVLDLTHGTRIKLEMAETNFVFHHSTFEFQPPKYVCMLLSTKTHPNEVQAQCFKDSLQNKHSKQMIKMKLAITIYRSYNTCNMCRNLSLGFTTKARACIGMVQEGSPGIAFHAPRSVRGCEGMNPHIPKWAPLWTPEFLRCDCKGQNPLDWKIIYIIGKLLKCKCL
jgi:hypothetical protein